MKMDNQTELNRCAIIAAWFWAFALAVGGVVVRLILK